MRTFLRVTSAFLIGLLVTYAVVVGALFAYATTTGVVDRDGGMAMAIVFVIGPLAGIVGGVACAIAMPIWLGRRDLARAENPLPPAPRWPRPVRTAIAAICAGAPVYLLGRFMLWLMSPLSFESYGTALVVSYAPLVAALCAGILAALPVLREAEQPAA